MKIELCSKEKTINKDIPSLTENNFWKAIGEFINSEIAIPNVVKARCEHSSACIKISQRGSYVEGGIEYPSMLCSVEYYIGELTPSSYEKKYLTCIHRESNNYKAYELTQLPNNTISARYGSLDEMADGKGRIIKNPFPSYYFWLKYYEKLSKGYKDQTDIYLAPVTKKETKKKEYTPTTDNEILYSTLLRFAKQKVSSVLAQKSVSIKQAKAARKIWNSLGKYKTVRGFNKHLEELLLVSPRKRNPLVDNVRNFFAKTKEDFAEILNREENLILAMESCAYASKDVETTSDSFKKFDIDVFKANDTQYKEVLNLLGNSHLASMVKAVYRVKPKKQEERFAKYCKENHISVIKKLWHGSRTENWASIIKDSLLLNPNAQITGKMFGNGIYFAPSPSKSFNYTSYKGTYWAKGSSDRGFMGIFACAYGKPLMVKTYGGNYESQVKNSDCNCLHATSSNTGLRADEIVFYNEDALCLNYIVEFG